MAEDYNLKHKQFAILGLLAENPQGEYPYNINKKIEERGMKAWTNIGFNFSLSTIYRILDRLEEDGLIESYTEEVDNRERKVYSMKNFGWEVLAKKIYTVLNNYIGRGDEDFYLAYSMFIYLPKKQRIEAFTNSHNLIQQHKEDLEKMLELNKKQPMTVTGLFKHPLMVLRTDIEFLEWVLEKIEKGDDEFGPEAYGK